MTQVVSILRLNHNLIRKCGNVRESLWPYHNPLHSLSPLQILLYLIGLQDSSKTVLTLYELTHYGGNMKVRFP